ncbi:DUF3592 domain-containing protein [Chitinophagaceae bacterium LWZ2-11]
MLRYRFKTNTYYRVNAVVIDNEIRKVSIGMMDYQYYYSPIVKFTDKEGNEQLFTAGQDNPDRPLYLPGTEIKLLVNKDDPSRFIFYDVVDGYVIPIVWIAFAIAIIIFGVYCDRNIKF